MRIAASLRRRGNRSVDFRSLLQALRDANWKRKTAKPVLYTICVTEEAVRRLLTKLDPGKTSGPENISTSLLKEPFEYVVPILTTIYQSTLSTRDVPADWKYALISPVYKNGKHYDPAQYRPTSLTCISYIMQGARAHHHQLNNGTPWAEQHAVHPTTCLQILQDAASGADGPGRAHRKHDTHILIMDFAKAFDKVNHSLLLQKLHHYAIMGEVKH